MGGEGEQWRVSRGEPGVAHQLRCRRARQMIPHTTTLQGRPALPRDTGYLLHALRAELQHPTSGDQVVYQAAPPSKLCAEGETPFEEPSPSAGSVEEPASVTGGGARVAVERQEHVGQPESDQEASASTAPRWTIDCINQTLEDGASRKQPKVEHATLAADQVETEVPPPLPKGLGQRLLILWLCHSDQCIRPALCTYSMDCRCTSCGDQQRISKRRLKKQERTKGREDIDERKRKSGDNPQPNPPPPPPPHVVPNRC